MAKTSLAKVGLSLIVLCLISAIVPVGAQANEGVINTNFPKHGDTQPSPAFRLFTLPTFGDYSNMETDPQAVSAAERDAVLTKAQTNLGGIKIISLNQWEETLEQLPAVQIINNVPIQGATYTIVLPPNWSRQAKIPILLSGNGAATSNNKRLWTEGDLIMVNIAVMMSGIGRSGVITAYSNAGGTESLGVDDHTYRSVGAFMDFMAHNGGDPQRVVTFGGSRGGLTALMWAVNPLKLNYNVLAVFADIPPTALTSLTQRSVQTYPGLGNVYPLVTHDPTSYQYGTVGGPDKIEARFLSAWIGTTDPVKADAQSPIGMARGLKGKVVVIGRGTHDMVLSLREFIDFDHRLTELNIAHSTVITLGQGHITNTFLVEQLLFYLDALSKGKTYQPPTGRFIYINTAPPYGKQVPLNAYLKNDLTAKPIATNELPFTAEFPAKAGVGLPVDITVCGASKSTYSYSAKKSSGEVWVEAHGTFDTSECILNATTAPTTPGDYAWTLTYNGKPIPSTNTPLRTQANCGLPAITVVLPQQPKPADALPIPDPSLSFGIDEFSVRKTGCHALNLFTHILHLIN